MSNQITVAGIAVIADSLEQAVKLNKLITTNDAKNLPIKIETPLLSSKFRELTLVCNPIFND